MGETLSSRVTTPALPSRSSGPGGPPGKRSGLGRQMAPPAAVPRWSGGKESTGVTFSVGAAARQPASSSLVLAPRPTCTGPSQAGGPGHRGRFGPAVPNAACPVCVPSGQNRDRFPGYNVLTWAFPVEVVQALSNPDHPAYTFVQDVATVERPALPPHQGQPSRVD